MSRVLSVSSVSLATLAAFATVAATAGPVRADPNALTNIAAAAAFARAEPIVTRIRHVDARFRNVAEAVKEGYAPIPCASGPNGGSMGVHYVNADLMKSGKLDIAHPQAVMYEPEPDGRMALVAVEYIAQKGPAQLDGHLFNYDPAPNRYGIGPFYDLHVWAWRTNPTGTFAEMNPDVSCDAMPLTGTNK